MNVVFKFSVYLKDGKSRITYRVIRTEDDDFIIQEYGSGMKMWFNSFENNVKFHSMHELFRSRFFRCLFVSY